MGKQISEGDTPFTLAQSLLGDGNMAQELMIPGWDGDPHHLPVGSMAYVKGEKMGPPAKWTADPSKLRGG
ncbi:MAG: hypothetical protein ACHQC8_02435 [Solirubrobacterales bacterium]